VTYSSISKVQERNKTNKKTKRKKKEYLPSVASDRQPRDRDDDGDTILERKELFFCIPPIARMFHTKRGVYGWELGGLVI
jgi:hypothetical protein